MRPSEGWCAGMDGDAEGPTADAELLSLLRSIDREDPSATPSTSQSHSDPSLSAKSVVWETSAMYFHGYNPSPIARPWDRSYGLLISRLRLDSDADPTSKPLAPLRSSPRSPPHAARPTAASVTRDRLRTVVTAPASMGA